MLVTSGHVTKTSETLTFAGRPPVIDTAPKDVGVSGVRNQNRVNSMQRKVHMRIIRSTKTSE